MPGLIFFPNVQINLQKEPLHFQEDLRNVQEEPISDKEERISVINKYFYDALEDPEIVPDQDESFPMGSPLVIPSQEEQDYITNLQTENFVAMVNQRQEYWSSFKKGFQRGLMPYHNIEELPDTTIFPGDYNFELSLGPHAESATKSADYTFSPILKKLYVQKGAHCPFKLKTICAPPPNTYIKVLPVYKGSHVLIEPVRRCSNHAESDDEGNLRYHFIRAKNGLTKYEATNSGRLYLTIPYTGPQVGAEYQTELLSFMCYNSCGHSSHSERRIDVIFMLENNSRVLGRQVIEVSVCACPERVRNTEESRMLRFLRAKGKQRGGNIMSIMRDGKRRKLSSVTGEEEFVMKTSNPIHYQMLCQIQDSLEIKADKLQENTQSLIVLPDETNNTEEEVS